MAGIAAARLPGAASLGIAAAFITDECDAQLRTVRLQAVSAAR